MQSTRRIMDALRHLVQAMRSFSSESEAEVGLPAAQLFALQVVVRDGPLSVNALAAKTHTHQSSVSVVARRLVEKRLLKRQVSPTDRRQVLLVATAKGQKLAEVAPSAVHDRLIEAIESLSATDRAKLTSLLEAVVAQVAPDGGHPPMFFESKS